MRQPTGTPSPAQTPPGLPQIPSCDVQLDADGQLLVTHRATGEAAVAADEEHAVIAGMILRILAAWRPRP
ncbi:hypothetical protein ACFFV7_50840 [Nonomuraea spiralis]|uniref:Uncharacterized protein n=1 Tax=Nonomuraea spiralis TaxID=46182 RepID=A0ABV5IYB0_9ACTN|nr:hypothetical protein [Nonomuraea spiralis]GGS88670.1 hypothetical protein GCM10010176_035580 [Nonomuraea spiralis]